MRGILQVYPFHFGNTQEKGIDGSIGDCVKTSSDEQRRASDIMQNIDDGPRFQITDGLESGRSNPI